jgi:hypothetical protein
MTRSFMKTHSKFQRTKALWLFLAATACTPAEVAPVVVESAPLQPLQERPPSVSATPARLVRTPTLAQLAAYSCSLDTADSIERQDCLDVFGPPPPYTALSFQLGTTITVYNPRDTPLPLSSVRILFKLFPNEKDEAVGTLCLRMCPPEDHACTGSVAPDGCSSSDAPVLRAEPAIARAIPSFFIGPTQSTIAVGLRKSQAAPHEELRIDLQFDLGSAPVLQHLTPVLKQRMKMKKPPELKEFQLPVSLEGGVFIRSMDPNRREPRIGAWFGPLTGTIAL